MEFKRNFKNIKINKNKDPLEVNEIRDLVFVASAFSFLFLYAVECSRERGEELVFKTHTRSHGNYKQQQHQFKDVFYRFQDLTRKENQEEKNENNKQNAPTQLQDFFFFFFP